jgi:type II secretory pathway component PulF
VPLFRYEALDRTGNKVVGAMQVADEQALAVRLASMGYQPTSVEIAQRSLRQAAQRSAVGAGSIPQAAAGPVSPLTASERALARMFHQLHISFRAGMPAFQAVSTVATQVQEPPLRQALVELSAGVRDGHRLSDLMERYPYLFTRGDVGMVRAAELAGFLPEALENLAVQHELDDNTRRRLAIWVWFFHLNVLGLLLFIPFCFFIIPAVEAGFNAMAGLRSVGQVFLVFSLPMGILYTALLVALARTRRSPRLAYRWHRLLLKLPVVGKINSLRANSVFTRTLQQLYQAGLPAATSWETASDAVPNRFLSALYLDGKPTVEATGRLSTAMQQVGLLDPADVGMVATGESSGEVPQALRYLADRYEEDTRVALGASVVRGAISFTTWAFLIGAIGLIIFFQQYGGKIFGAVEKGVGGGE